ncbi:uncharacterized protein LOC116174616 [Photinus pyralis]|uniref:uncharacterized protein LOC116174616 n=1 Tax=Photinus pyralis TaxID=7054 RepID=UPI0012670E56|nr:uncharacterized protein LOC116174616 [Photinus pyralis]
MAQPLQDGAAAFCLTLFGSNNTFTHEDVLLRWKYIQQETTNYNIVVDGISSDGDSRCLKAMKIIAGLPAFSKQETPYSPYFQANFDINNLVPIQDTVHIATKMKNRLLNEKIVLEMGNYEVSKDHLTDLINTVSKDKHLLCLSYLDSSDKMNFEAIDKLSSTRVISLLTSDEALLHPVKVGVRLAMSGRYSVTILLIPNVTGQCYKGLLVNFTTANCKNYVQLWKVEATVQNITQQQLHPFFKN